MNAPSGAVLWAQRRLPEGKGSWGKFEEPRWHRVVSVTNVTVTTECHRIRVGAATAPRGAERTISDAGRAVEPA